MVSRNTGGLSRLNKTTGRTVSYVFAADDAPNNIKATADLQQNDMSNSEIQSMVTAATGGKVVFIGNFVKSAAAGLELPDDIEVEIIGSITVSSGINDDLSVFTNDKVTGNDRIRITGGIIDGEEWNQSSGSQYAFDFENVTNLYIDVDVRDMRTADELIIDCPGYYYNNRFYSDKPIVRKIADCEETTDFGSASGVTFAKYTTEKYEGTACIQVTTTGGAGSGFIIQPP